MEEMVLYMRIIGRKTLMPFQKGLLMSIRSLLGLHNYLQKINSLKYIITCRLNQDLLEKLCFIHVSEALVVLIITQHQHILRACVEDDGVRKRPYLTSQMFTELNVNATENKDEENEEVQEEDVVTLLTRSWEENEALRYVAGYLVNACEDEGA
ncbi:hypothetical protein PR048_017489 [Dryococelus australis]|uniref:Uncharacterized protein n=1 Tax=Dryococelus australis TaxID=614101 RepID=A0ABQ9H9X8_9NEOP|nr:hypothetical protein PR048_017489 [Dryococelus australis]